MPKKLGANAQKQVVTGKKCRSQEWGIHMENTDNRRQRSIKCSERCWHLHVTPSNSAHISFVIAKERDGDVVRGDDWEDIAGAFRGQSFDQRARAAAGGREPKNDPHEPEAIDSQTTSVRADSVTLRPRRVPDLGGMSRRRFYCLCRVDQFRFRTVECSHCSAHQRPPAAAAFHQTYDRHGVGHRFVARA